MGEDEQRRKKNGRAREKKVILVPEKKCQKNRRICEKKVTPVVGEKMSEEPQDF